MDGVIVDTHICIRCSETIVGIDAYVDHRKTDCLLPVPPPVEEPPMIPDAPELPDFFSSLDLQRIIPLVHVENTGVPSSDSESEDPLKPPRYHTGGKWRPGSRPSIMQSMQHYRDRTPSPERLPTHREKMGCAPCGRIFRDKYTYQRHLESYLHRKRSLQNARQTNCVSENYPNSVGKRIPERVPESIPKAQELETAGKVLRAPDKTQIDFPDDASNCTEMSAAAEDLISFVTETESSRITRRRTSIPEKEESVFPLELQSGGRRCSPFKDGTGRVPNEKLTKRSSRARISKISPSHVEAEILVGDAESRPRKKLRCPICYKWFINASSVEAHRALKHKMNCQTCGYKASNDSELREHLKTHIQHWTCCGKLFTTKKGLREHKESHHQALIELLDCLECGGKFLHKRALRDHKCPKFCEPGYSLKCQNCDYTTSSQKNLAMHNRVHSKEQPFTCDKCDYRAARHGQLWRHKKQHEVDKKLHKCPYCDFTCTLIENLRNHIKKSSKHKGLKVYPCTKCSFSTDSAKEAKLHAISHL